MRCHLRTKSMAIGEKNEQEIVSLNGMSTNDSSTEPVSSSRTVALSACNRIKTCVSKSLLALAQTATVLEECGELVTIKLLVEMSETLLAKIEEG